MSALPCEQLSKNVCLTLKSPINKVGRLESRILLISFVGWWLNLWGGIACYYIYRAQISKQSNCQNVIIVKFNEKMFVNTVNKYSYPSKSFWTFVDAFVACDLRDGIRL